MEQFYLILIIVLFLLAFSDLIVGVSNDAVNFLNSAIGSKAAPFKVIMAVAAVGIIIGTLFSEGMMEVARKGIIHPEHFYFSEVIIIFLAVMITDVILLDFYNTFGLPTSTTVSLVSELIGASLAVAIIKVTSSPDVVQSLGHYLNYERSLTILTAILASVAVAFTVGAIVQYFTRLIFTFNYKKNLKYFGAIWGGLAITLITYFIVIKGAKGASFMTKEILLWIKANTPTLLLISFAGWTILLQLVYWIVKINVLKVVILIGTFALALAFASNDLVNFIGVPLAGLTSYQIFLDTPGAHPDTLLMEGLAGDVNVKPYFLILAGIIMAITLYLSKKARSVTKTEVDLGRQHSGAERFGSNVFSRAIVRASRNVAIFTQRITPAPIKNSLENRFREFPVDTTLPTTKDRPSFDLLRASVNLVVASTLIAFGTSLKLPLSTTYVTFMVAMGTSLSDRAWGRDSAVYRVTGVLTVIGGWFLTGFLAFTSAMIMAFLIHWGGMIAIGILGLLALFLVIRTHKIHLRLSRERAKKDEVYNQTEVTIHQIIAQYTSTVISCISSVEELYSSTIRALKKESLRELKKNNGIVHQLDSDTKDLKVNLHQTIAHLSEESFESGSYYVQIIDDVRDLVHAITFIVKPSLDHVDNNHKGLASSQLEELNDIGNNLGAFFSSARELINSRSNFDLVHISNMQEELFKKMDIAKKHQIRRIRKAETGTKNSILYLSILQETKNLVLITYSLLKSHREFISAINK
jgi:phosphate/sulfate permease